MSDPNDYEFWYKKAMGAISFNGITGEISKYLKNALKLNPDHIESWIYYSGYNAMRNNNEIVVETLNEIFKYLGKFEETTGQIPDLIKKILKDRDKDRVISYANCSCSVDGTHCGFHIGFKVGLKYCGMCFILAVYYLRGGDLKKAGQAFEKSFSFPRNQSKTIFKYFSMIFFYMTGDLDTALEYGKAAVAVDIRFKSVWLVMSRIYCDKEKYSEALKSLNTCLKIDPHYELALEFKKTIESKLEEARDINQEKNGYLGEKLSKKEIEFVLDLEKEFGAPIPILSKVIGHELFHNFGIVVENGHITELGINPLFNPLNQDTSSLINSKNKISKIPDSIKDLEFLEILSVKDELYLKEFPENIVFLKRLKYFAYNHSYIRGSSLPSEFCNLESLEELNLSGTFKSLPECLIYLPKLKKIDLSFSHLLIPPIFNDYFEREEHFQPHRLILHRKGSIPQRSIGFFDPVELHANYIEEKISRDELVNELLKILRNEYLLDKLMQALELIDILHIKNDSIFNILKELIEGNNKKIIRKIATKLILRYYPEQSKEFFMNVLLKGGSIDLTSYTKKLLMENNSDINLCIRNEFSDLIAITDIQKAMGTILPEIKNFNITKNKYQQRIDPHGYILKDDRIIKLGINLQSRYDNYKKIGFPKNIAFLDALEELKICDTRYKGLESLPETIGVLSNLKKLELFRCRYFVEMPKSISMLNRLEILNLSECYSLKRLPEEIGGLKNLKELNLSECSSLEELPEHIGDLTSLEILNLENCRSLKSIPSSLTQLPNLKVLNLRKCRTLQRIPESLSNIITLNEVSLSGCSRLLELPEKLDFFKHQEKVDLSYCYQLKELPQSVNKLNRLRKLNLHGCRSLLSLPSSLVDLSNLEELDLSACIRLNNLPKNLGNLRKIELLDISYCDSLKSLPKSIINLKDLKKFDLSGSFESVPEFLKPTNLIDAIEIQSITSKSNDTPTEDQTYELSPEILKLEKGNPYWPENIKNYQKSIQTQFNFPPEILEENKMQLIKEGVEEKDAETLAKFFITLDSKLDKSFFSEIKDFEEDLAHNDMENMYHYRINSQGKIVEIHLHHGESCYLWIFPKEICDLENLEVIRLPNNRIEVIPECVTKLNFLRVLDLSNNTDIGFNDPIIPDSIRSFTQSLEVFNQFYYW